MLGLVARFRTTLFCLGSSTHCSCNSPLRLPPLALVPSSGSSGSGHAIFAGVLCFVARLDVAHVLGKSLQRGAQPSLVLSLLLVLGLMHVRNSRHLGNECFDDLIDGFMDGHCLQSSEFAVLGAFPDLRVRVTQRQLVSWNLVRRHPMVRPAAWKGAATFGRRQRYPMR